MNERRGSRLVLQALQYETRMLNKNKSYKRRNELIFLCYKLITLEASHLAFCNMLHLKETYLDYC